MKSIIALSIVYSFSSNDIPSLIDTDLTIMRKNQRQIVNIKNYFVQIFLNNTYSCSTLIIGESLKTDPLQLNAAV